MTESKEKQGENSFNDEQRLAESQQLSDSEREQRTRHRANQQQRLIISLLIFIIIAWVLGSYNASSVWIFALLAWVILWWKSTATRAIDLAAREAEIDKRRERAFSSAETTEWLNFMINRW